MKPKKWNALPKKEQRRIAVKLFNSTRGQSVMSQALETAIKAVNKTDVNTAVRAQMDVWNKFWNKGSIHLGKDDEGASMARALVIRRFNSTIRRLGGMSSGNRVSTASPPATSTRLRNAQARS